MIDGNGQHQEPDEAKLWPEPQPLPDLLPPQGDCTITHFPHTTCRR